MDINFPSLVCPKCNSKNHFVVQKKYRYGIYCKDCMVFIRWASDYEQSVIKSRKAWLKEHEQSNN